MYEDKQALPTGEFLCRVIRATATVIDGNADKHRGKRSHLIAAIIQILAESLRRSYLALQKMAAGVYI